jgi:hypothetical protein
MQPLKRGIHLRWNYNYQSQGAILNSPVGTDILICITRVKKVLRLGSFWNFSYGACHNTTSLSNAEKLRRWSRLVEKYIALPIHRQFQVWCSFSLFGMDMHYNWVHSIFHTECHASPPLGPSILFPFLLNSPSSSCSLSFTCSVDTPRQSWEGASERQTWIPFSLSDRKFQRFPSLNEHRLSSANHLHVISKCSRL